MQYQSLYIDANELYDYLNHTSKIALDIMVLNYSQTPTSRISTNHSCHHKGLGFFMVVLLCRETGLYDVLVMQS